jgi:hypothetical protein
MKTIAGWGWGTIAIGIVAVFGGVAGIGLFWDKLHSASMDTTTAVAVIAGTAVVIERVLEFIWTLVDQVSNDWPNAIGQEVSGFVSALSVQVAPFVERAKAEVDLLKKSNTTFGAEAAKIESTLASIQTATNGLAKSAPDAQRIQYIAKLMIDTTATLRRFERPVDDVHQFAAAALDQLTAFLATFADNPGRRLISILFGSLLGLVLAISLGLDVFRAATGAVGARWWGVALTGLVMGLGSSPTHEVILALQEFKKNQKTA